MAASGEETIKLSQLKTYADSVTGKINAKADSTELSKKLDAPAATGTTGQVLSTTGSATQWITIETGSTYTGTAPIVVSGTVISVNEASERAYGTVMFATDAEFNAYLGIS